MKFIYDLAETKWLLKQMPKHTLSGSLERKAPLHKKDGIHSLLK